jgi:STE24 endopeptidase
LFLSRFEYLAVNSTRSVVSAPAGTAGASSAAASSPQPAIVLQRLRIFPPPRRVPRRWGDSPPPGAYLVTMRARRFSFPAAVVVAAVVAEAAVWLLRPDGLIDPLPVSESSYFTPAQLERAHDFRDLQRLIGIGALVAEGALLALLVARPPREAVARAERLARCRPLAAAAGVGAVVVVAVQAVSLPVGAWAHERAVDVGLSTQDWGAWLSDRAKAGAIAVVLGAAGVALFTAIIRRFPRRWWAVGAAAVVAVEIVFVWLAPVVLDPLFNRYEDLPPGRTRSAVNDLARRAGVDVGDVLVVDASRRTRAANAYVTGLGDTKRVVLFDTLLERFPHGQVELVVAHELAHVKQRDLARGMLWVAIVAPAGMYVVMLLTRRWSARAGAAPGDPASVPALALALAVVAFGLNVVSNQLSRAVERRADAYSLELTGQPREFIQLERRLALANVADPDAPAAYRFLFGTHPSTVERIGIGLAYERRR